MPAVQLARLRIQTTQLSESFDDPLEFSNGLESLLELYGNLAYRPGHDVIEHSRLPAYNVPPLVMRQLEIELGRVARADPESCLRNIDQLWRIENLEMREMAIFLLGQVPPEFLPQISDRLQAWAGPATDPGLLKELLSSGGAPIRRADAKIWLSISAEWLHSPNTYVVGIGLQSLEPFLGESGMKYLPQVFNLLDPLVADPPPAAISALEKVLLQIYQISPMETQSFLRKNLEAGPKPQYIRLIRRLLPNLSPETQRYLRSFIPRQEADLKSR